MRAVNLIPSDQRSGGVRVATGQSEGAAFIVLGLIVGLALLAFLYGKAKSEVSSARSEVAKVTAQAQATEAKANQLAPYTNFNTLYEERAKDVSQLIGTRFDWAHAFHELGRVLPTNVSLNSVTGTIGSATGSSGSAPKTTSTAGAAASGTSVGSATPPGSVPTLVLAGCTSSQSAVAIALSQLRLIDGVSEVTLQSSTKSTSSGSGGNGSGSNGSSCPVTFSTTVTFTALPVPSTATAPHASAVANTNGPASTAPASTQPTSTQPAATKQSARARTVTTTSSNSNNSPTARSASTRTDVSTVNASGGHR